MNAAILAYEPMYSYIIKTLGTSYQEMTFDYYLIKEGTTVSSVFQKIRDKYDAFITGGGIMNIGIRDAKENSDIIIEAISTDSLGICKNLVKIATENSLNNFERVFFDFVHDEKSHKIMEDLIGSDKFLHIPLKNEREKPVVITSFDDVAPYLKETYSALLEKGLMDIAVTRYSNITPYLDAMGIKYYFVYPSREHLFNVARAVLVRYKLRQQKLSSPAFIQIMSRGSAFEIEENYDRIKSLLNEYASGLGKDFIIDESYRGIQVFTTLRTLKTITNNFSCCNLGSYLNENSIKSVLIAYGYGNDTFTAHFNSLSALKKIEEYENVSAVFINEEANILERKKFSDVRTDEFYLKISKEVSISPQILKKINGISAKNKISAKVLGEMLNVTQRSASRYLTRLVEGNLAVKLENSKSTGKGRPQELYKICFPEEY